MNKFNRNSIFQNIILLLGGAALLFIIAPLIGMYLKVSPAEFFNTAVEEKVSGSIWLTLWTAMAGTIFFSALSIPLAYIMARKEFPLKGLINGLIDIPVIIPHSAAGIALLSVISREGVFGSILEKAGLSLVGNEAGIILAMSFVSIPFLINAARDGFAAVPIKLEKAALNLGASPTRVFFTISLPLAWRSILSGLILMWARGMSEFGAVIIVAYNPITTPVLIYERFGAYGLKYSTPVAVVFVTICLIIFIGLRLLGKKKNA